MSPCVGRRWWGVQKPLHCLVPGSTSLPHQQRQHPHGASTGMAAQAWSPQLLALLLHSHTSFQHWQLLASGPSLASAHRFSQGFGVRLAVECAHSGEWRHSVMGGYRQGAGFLQGPARMRTGTLSGHGTCVSECLLALTSVAPPACRWGAGPAR